MLGDNFVDTVEVSVARKKIWRLHFPLSNKMAAKWLTKCTFSKVDLLKTI